MNQFFSTYGSVIVTVVIALVLVIALLKIAIAVEHAVVRIATSLLTITVLGVVLVAGFTLLGRVSAIQNAATAAVQGIGESSQTPTGTIPAATLTQNLDASARRALLAVGLNPAYLRLYVSCAGPRPRLHLIYADDTFMFGALSSHDYTVPVPNIVRC